MAFDVRACTSSDELLDALMCIGQYFGLERSPERAERFLKVLEVDRMHAAYDADGAAVGGAGAFAFQLAVPGGVVPTAGVTVVGVYPTHRRRGVLRALMRAQLDDVRRRGEPLAALWASEETIYGRFGYGVASLTGDISVPTEYASYARPFQPAGRVRLVEPAEALQRFPAIWDAALARTPGMFARSQAWWEVRTVGDPPDRREGAGPKRFALLELDGRPQGYAIYRHRPGFADAVSIAALEVVEAVAADGQATAELWRYLLDIDWNATVNARLLPVDHPLFLLLARPRRLRFRVVDGLWVRLVEVGAALSARTYASGEPLVFEVRDELCPWNEGRWRLAEGVCARTGDEPDLRLGVDALGSAYLGGLTFGELARAGRVEEARPGTLARATAEFATERAPWCPEIF